MIYHGEMDEDFCSTAFTLRDPRQEYTVRQVANIVRQADAAGVVFLMGCCIECLSVAQLDALVNDPRKCDA
jgi:hypothetical protein